MRCQILSLLVLLSGGCAISQARYDELAGETEARNDRRRERAVAELLARGYVFDRDAARFALFLDDGDRQRCLTRHEADASALDASRPVVLTITAAGSSTPRTTLTVTTDEACRFFRGQLATLGEEPQISRIDGALARDRQGRLYQVEVRVHELSHRKLLVRRTCNLMPTVEPDPLELAQPIAVVLGPPLPRLQWNVEREELDLECTDNVY
jgi:hypothetical protein